MMLMEVSGREQFAFPLCRVSSYAEKNSHSGSALSNKKFASFYLENSLSSG